MGKRTRRYLSISVICLGGFMASTSGNSREHHQETDSNIDIPRKLNAVQNLPKTYGQIRPAWLNENYGQQYGQRASPHTWEDPAQTGLNFPGWLKYLDEYTAANRGAMNPPLLTYTPNDYTAVRSWIQDACPSFICRSYTLNSQPNTGSAYLHFGRDLFGWYYLLARIGTQNGGGQLLKFQTDLTETDWILLRNLNGKWNRDTMKFPMNTIDDPTYGILRLGIDEHMRDSLWAQMQGSMYGLGAFSALSPYPANRYRGYYSPRHLQEQENREKEQQRQQQQQQQEEQKQQQQQHMKKKKRSMRQDKAAGRRRHLSYFKTDPISMTDALAQLESANVVKPVIPPGSIEYGPAPPRPQFYKPVLPAYYHYQVSYPKPTQNLPLVLGEHPFIHPKLAAYFTHTHSHPPLDYEHALCDNGYCPGRRRRRKLATPQRKKIIHRYYLEDKQEPDGIKVYLGQHRQEVLSIDEADKGLFFHKKKYAMPKITKVVPLERPYEYQPKTTKTIYKPIHRIYRNPQPSIIVVVPPKKKHKWFQHPLFNHAG